MKHRHLLIFHGIPLTVILFPFVWYTIFGDEYLKGEDRIVENATVLFLFIAIGSCFSSLILANRLRIRSFLRTWLFLLKIGSAYFAGGKISYGQHMFGWETAELWKELNKQDETNLHNTHAMFNTVPRALLTLAILIGGVILPIYRRFRNIPLDESSRLYWQWPTIDCVTIGLMVILIRPLLSLIEPEYPRYSDLIG